MECKLSEKVAQLPPSATEQVEVEVRRLRNEGVTDIISLGVGEPCFDTPEHIKEAAWHALQQGKTKYVPTRGDRELRDAVAQKLKRENGINVSANDVLVTAGAKFAIFLVLQSLLGPGDRVMLLEPAWVTYEPSIRLAGADVIHVPCLESDGFVPDPDRVRALMDPSVRLLVLNSPCNPTGAVYDKATLRELTETARKHGVWVLSDEPYEYLIYEGEHYSPASEFDNVITVNALSKSHAMTGWRLGYCAGPASLLDAMTNVYQHSTTCVTSFAQAGAIEALTSERSLAAVDAMLRGYKDRRAAMMRAIDASEYLDCRTAPQGTFYCYPSYRADLPSVDMATRLLIDAHVATVPGSAFGAAGEGYLRLSYSTAEENIPQAFARMEKTLCRLSKPEA